jgi:seryl-tRNA synthetase
MISIKYLRENPQIVKENIKKKNLSSLCSLVDKCLDLDKEYRDLIKETNSLKHKRNEITNQIKIYKTQGEDITSLIKEAKDLPKLIKEKDETLKKLKEEIDNILYKLPTIISKETPVGKDENDNKEIKRYSEPIEYDFDLLGHVELAEQLNLVDFEASRNVTGKGFFYLLGDLALLNEALIRYAEDFMNKKGYTFVSPPLMINRSACKVISYEDFKDSIFKVEGKDLHLIASSELSLINLFKDKVIDEDKLPIKLYAYSPCFRQEIGSHGVDERGLFRVHQFDKVEQIIICKPENSKKYFDEILENQKEILLDLDFTLRNVEICSGDLGSMKYRQVDSEVWGPKREEWIELGSCSNLVDSQSLKLNIKVKTKDGNKYYPHTLNNTALATTRTIVALLENFQTKNKTIKIPSKLVPYMYGKKEIKKNKTLF